MKVYRIAWNTDIERKQLGQATLETATLIRTDIDRAAGASAPTDLVREADGRVARCTPGMWLKSAEEAWRGYLADLDGAIHARILEMERLAHELAHWQKERDRVRAMDISKPTG